MAFSACYQGRCLIRIGRNPEESRNVDVIDRIHFFINESFYVGFYVAFLCHLLWMTRIQ